MSDSPTSYICGSCLKRYATDGICQDCKISLVAIDTIPCPSCGSELPADATFCTHCGVSLESRCSNCGTALGAEDLFCQTCGTKNETAPAPLPQSKSKSDVQLDLTPEDVLGLVYEPVSLREFRSKFSALTTGPDSAEYNLAIERGLSIAEEPPEIVRLGTYPRFWAIDRPFILKRLMTMAVDSFAWLVLYLVGLELSEHPLFVLIWLVGSYFLYTAVAERKLGTTLGGLIFGTRVVNEYCNPLTMGQIIGRQIKRIFAPILLIFWQSQDNEIVNY